MAVSLSERAPEVWVDAVDNRVWPLTGRTRWSNGADVPPKPIWKRRAANRGSVPPSAAFVGLKVSRDSELAFELNDPPGGEGWRVAEGNGGRRHGPIGRGRRCGGPDGATECLFETHAKTYRARTVSWKDHMRRKGHVEAR